jgi:hypothetical protein
MHVVERRPVHQSFYIVLVGEALHLMEPVLKYALVQIAGEANVQGTRQTSHDIDAVASALSGSHKELGMLRLLSMTGCERLLKKKAETANRSGRRGTRLELAVSIFERDDTATLVRAGAAVGMLRLRRIVLRTILLRSA